MRNFQSLQDGNQQLPLHKRIGIYSQLVCILVIPSALAHALATSSRIGSPKIRQSLPHFRPIYSAKTAKASLFNVRLCFLVNILNAIGRKCESSICTGRKVAGDCCRGCRFNMDEGTGWNGSELGGTEAVDLSALFLGLLNIGATVDILLSASFGLRLADVVRRRLLQWMRSVCLFWA